MSSRILAFVLALALIAGVVIFIVLPRSAMPQMAQNALAQAADATTSGKVKSAFALSKRLSPYDISVDSRDGVVTLKGKVTSDIDKELAASVAKDTTGVKQVNNELIVEPGVKPSDASLRESARVADLEIQADLRERLAASEELRGQPLQVAVQNRVVTLTGQVETPAQKTGAEQLARAVSNVANVVNNLNVTNPAANQTAVPGVPDSVLKDQELAKQVSFALFNARDNFVNASAIRAESRDGEVTLAGTVASRAERVLAERIAHDVAGVKSVRNQLTISFTR